jgi:hypothetical protein
VQRPETIWVAGATGVQWIAPYPLIKLRLPVDDRGIALDQTNLNANMMPSAELMNLHMQR